MDRRSWISSVVVVSLLAAGVSGLAPASATPSAQTVPLAVVQPRPARPDAPAPPASPEKPAPGAHPLAATPRFGLGISKRSLAAARAVATPQVPFSQCPAVGLDTSCGVLVQITDGGTNVFSDPTQSPYDGVEDTLIGVVNDSTRPLASLQLSSNTDLFGFDGDGLCNVSPAPGGCPFGPTGYEGPNTSFSNLSSDLSGGVVNFATALAPGATAYFSLEEALTATAVFAGGPTASEQGRGPNPSQHITTCFAKQPITVTAPPACSCMTSPILLFRAAARR